MSEWSPAGDAEGWVLATGLAGWVPTEELDAASTLRAEIKALEARRNGLQLELRAAVDDARARGTREGLAGAEAFIVALRDAKTALVEKAGSAALSAAEVIVGESLESRAASVLPLVERALNADASRMPTRIAVSETLCASVRRALPDHEVVGDPRLQPGDVVVHYASGKTECRLSDLLSSFADDLRHDLAAEHD